MVINNILMTLSHPYFKRNTIDEFQTKLDKCTVTIGMNGNYLPISVRGRTSRDKIVDLMLEVFSLMFICLGGFPTIEGLYFNDEAEDISNWAGKYSTDKYFQKKELAIGFVDEVCFCQKTLDEYRKIPNLPIYTLQYLVSSNYKHVVTNHKITLLTHVIDGIIDDSVVNNAKAEMRNKYKIQGRIGDYSAKVYCLLKGTFFRDNRKYSAGILSILRQKQYEFIMTVSDTRNSYSHYLKPNKKTNKLTKGDEMIVYFEIILFALRLEVFKMIGLTTNEDAVKEYWYMLHDWIRDLKNKKTLGYKSQTYKIIEGREEMYNALKLMQERGELT